LVRLAGLIDKLLVYPDTMLENLEKTGGLVFSQAVMLALTQKGVTREDAYKIVQRNAMKVWESRGKLKFIDVLSEDKDLTAHLDPRELKNIFDYKNYTKHVDSVLKRALA